MKGLTVYDDTLRDGEQQTGVVFTINEKLELAKKISETRVDFIHFMVGVHEEEDALIKKIVDEKIGTLSTSVLMNKASMDLAKNLGVKRIVLFSAVSNILARAKDAPLEHMLKNAVECLEYAKSLGFEIDFAAEDGSRADFDFLFRFVKTISNYIDHFIFCDTVGCLQPNITHKLVKDLIRETNCKIGVHFHNDLGLAVENTIQAVLAGAELISGTFTGIGERAGNAALETVLLRLKEEHGIVAQKIDYSKLSETAKLVKELACVGQAEPLSEEAFRTEAGIHVHCLLKDPLSYSLFPNRPMVVYCGKYSGVSNYKYIFEHKNNTFLPEERYKAMRDKIKKMSLENKKSYSMEEIIRMYQRGEI